MAAGWSRILSFTCLIFFLGQAESAENLNCHALEKVFPSCPCYAASEENRLIDAIVDCSNQALKEVPRIEDSFSKPIYKLSLKNNNISLLTNNSFQGLKIEHLDLSGNSLASVESDTFLSTKESLTTLEIDGDSQSGPPINALSKLTNLQHLTLRHYSVQYLEKDFNYFLPFTYLKSLTLDQWNTEHIEGSSFLGPEKLQSLSLLNMMKLENLPLEALAQDPFDHLETLRISFTKISKITESIFSNLSSLKHLDLSNNQINNLEKDCFAKVEDTLQSIDLHGNNLNNVDTSKLEGLSGLTALTQLDFSQNTFKQIPSMPNLGSTKPLILFLSENEIEEVRANAFNGYAQSLKELDLSKNYIRGMDPASFSGVTQLNSLHLNHQRGGNNAPLKLPSSLSNSASTIRSLDLSGQKVDPDSLWNVVKEFISLRNLNLNSVELDSIPDLIFNKVTALEQLDLSFNRLSQVNQKSFAGLRQLKEIGLEGNSISTIPSCTFHGFVSSKIILTLKNNPIDCNDCGVAKLLEDKNNGLIEIDPAATCATGQPLANISPNTACGPEEESCIDYYSTTPPPVTSDPVTDPTPPILKLRIMGKGFNSLNVTWNISDDTFVKNYKLIVKKSLDNENILFSPDNFEKTTIKEEVTGLPPGTFVTVCVTVSFHNAFRPITECEDSKTLTKDDKQKVEDNSESADTGIIVGCVVAGVALAGVIAAIIILFIFRKNPKKIPENNLAPTQPRNFAKAELPSMTGESRMFKKAAKKNNNNDDKGMQVVAISDGQTSPGARVGRANMMFQGDDYEPMDHFKKRNGESLYENENELPPTPGRDSVPPAYPGGYYNRAFHDDKYDQIEVEL